MTKLERAALYITTTLLAGLFVFTMIVGSNIDNTVRRGEFHVCAACAPTVSAPIPPSMKGK